MEQQSQGRASSIAVNSGGTDLVNVIDSALDESDIAFLELSFQVICVLWWVDAECRRLKSHFGPKLRRYLLFCQVAEIRQHLLVPWVGILGMMSASRERSRQA